MTARIGSEASMIAHAASYGVVWHPEEKRLGPPVSTVTWSDPKWRQWGSGPIRRHGEHKRRGQS